jgi:hypothetical protein
VALKRDTVIASKLTPLGHKGGLSNDEGTGWGPGIGLGVVSFNSEAELVVRGVGRRN